GAAMRMQPKVDARGGNGHEGADHVLTGRGIVQVDRMRHAIQGHARKYSGQPEAVVAVDMRDADARDLAGRGTCLDHLPLGGFSRVEEQALAIPMEHISVMVAGPGRNLGGSAENNEFTHGTECLIAWRLRPQFWAPLPGEG